MSVCFGQDIDTVCSGRGQDYRTFSTPSWQEYLISVADTITTNATSLYNQPWDNFFPVLLHNIDVLMYGQ